MGLKAGVGAAFLDYEAVLELEAHCTETKRDRMNLGLEISVELSCHQSSTVYLWIFYKLEKQTSVL